MNQAEEEDATNR